MPRSRTAAGSPRAARSVPGGVSRAKAGIPIASPTTISGMPGQRLASVRPAIVSPAPSVRTSASGRRRRASTATSCSLRDRGRGRDRPDRRHGHDRRDRDQRQQPQEHEPPVEDLRDEAGDERPEQARAGPRPSTSWRTSGPAAAPAAPARSRRRRPPGSPRRRVPGGRGRRRGPASTARARRRRGRRRTARGPAGTAASATRGRSCTPAAAIPTRLARMNAEKTQP